LGFWSLSNQISETLGSETFYIAHLISAKYSDPSDI
jgi:hypothetical protein